MGAKVITTSDQDLQSSRPRSRSRSRHENNEARENWRKNYRRCWERQTGFVKVFVCFCTKYLVSLGLIVFLIEIARFVKVLLRFCLKSCVSLRLYCLFIETSWFHEGFIVFLSDLTGFVKV